MEQDSATTPNPIALLEKELRELLDSSTLTEDQKQSLFRELLAVAFPKEP